jgi:hypothetical protein
MVSPELTYPQNLLKLYASIRDPYGATQYLGSEKPTATARKAMTLYCMLIIP